MSSPTSASIILALSVAAALTLATHTSAMVICPSADCAFASTAENTTSSKDSTPQSSSSSNCFPASATVELASGEFVAMSSLNTGDVVRVPGGRFSPVFMWTHREALTSSNFVRLSTEVGRLTATPGHFVFAAGSSSMRAAVPIEDVVVGDLIFSSSGAPWRVSKVETITDVGLYNPQTIHGDIVVDGFEATTYTKAVEPCLAHALLAPLRYAWSASGFDFTAAFDVARSVSAVVSV